MPRKEANRQGEGSKGTADIFFGLGLNVAAPMARGGALAEDHLAKAISHTKEAIDHGKMGNPHVFVAHALPRESFVPLKAALDHPCIG
jgi:hypothetical protein